MHSRLVIVGLVLSLALGVGMFTIVFFKKAGSAANCVTVLAYPADSVPRPPADDRSLREQLAKLSHTMLVVCETEDGVEPVRHFRQGASRRRVPLEATWDKPVHVSDYLIFDDQADGLGLVVRAAATEKWRFYRLTDDVLAKMREYRRLVMPALDSLPLLEP